MMHAPDSETVIYTYWREGLGIGQTIKFARQVHGLELAFEQVRQRFAAFSWWMA